VTRTTIASACCLASLCLAACSGDSLPDGGAGAVDGFWRYGSGTATRFSGAGPGLSQGTFDASGAPAWPLLDDAADIVLELAGTTLREHVWFHSSSVYFTTTQEVTPAGSTTSEVPDVRARRVTQRRGTFARSFRLKNGALVMTTSSSTALGSSPDQLLLETTCTRLTGGFPPAGWPLTSVPVE